MPKIYEVRDPIYGFIEFNEWEREIVNHPVFQRLRRIRQLGLTDMVYPGAMHTRFEHSLGVMHLATRVFDEIVKRRKDFLKNELNFTDGGLERDRTLLRISCLLHDVGHAPFSHAAEELMPSYEAGKSYKHEDYSAATVLYLLKDVIENHPLNQNHKIKAEEVANFIKGSPELKRSLLWRSLLSSQLDADRGDYLLRDSYHIGVAYGKYDLNRLIVTMTVTIDQENNPVLAVEEGGIHSAEALIIARYMMFTQVYFQHTRRAYDFHLAKTMRSLLSEKQKASSLSQKDAFPPPTSKENIEEYLKWTDWLVLGEISNGNGGEHGEILSKRRHHRKIYETSEVPTQEELDFLGEAWDEIINELNDDEAFIDRAKNSWYKFDNTDIPILIRPNEKTEELTYLSRLSSAVSGLKPVDQTRIYVTFSKKDEVKRKVEEMYSKKYKKEERK
ncbi:MAG: HD domain-containing protein [Thermodesulfovibrionales bacterium]|nr:HD domain-containing protein [Thermodesulfovibrionales bacterium]